MAFIKNISQNQLPDSDLLATYKQTGDVAILGDLYQRYMDLVYGVCLKYYKDTEASKDAVMLIFEELVEKLKKHEVENFRGWLHQVAKNHCLMQLRKTQKVKTVEFNTELMQSGENMHLDGVLEKEENFKKLAGCLETLSGDQETAIRLFYLDGKSYNEIVSISGIEWNAVRSLIQNGRRNLKMCMDKAITAENAGDIYLTKEN